MISQASTAPGVVTACADVSGIEWMSRSKYHEALAAFGARPEPLYEVILPSPLGWYNAKQSPPIPVDCGSIPPSNAQAPTAAPAAVPPACRTSIAVNAASGCEVATMAFWAWTVERPAKWKFLMRSCSLDYLSGGLAAYLAYSAGCRQMRDFR